MIEGKVRPQTEQFVKKVGIFEAEVICINTTTEEFKEVLNIDLKEDSKAAEYLGESKEGNNYLRLNFWLKNIKTGEIWICFFINFT